MTSAPGGITCPSTCSNSFPAGSTVVLTAVAQTGYAFSGWTVNGCSGTGPCTLTVSTDLNVVAAFVSTAVQLTVTQLNNGGASGTVTSSPAGISCTNNGLGACTAGFPPGTVVTLTATPAAGKLFGGWSGGGCAATTNPCVLTLASATSVQAAFNQGLSLAVALTGDGAGNLTSTPAGINCSSGSSTGCSYVFPDGTAVSLTATPAAGSSYAGFGFGGCNGNNYARTCPIALGTNSTTNVTAAFSAWTVKYPFPEVVAGLAASGTTLVAAGRGAVATSTDGQAWTGRPRPGSAVNAIASDPASGLLVAVGNAGSIASSSDAGQTWTTQPSGVTVDLRGAAFLPPSTFIAVGKGGTILTAAKTALGTWTAATSGTTQDLNAAGFGNSLAVAVGYNGTLLTSPDGVTWTPRTAAPATTQYLTSVAFGPSGFVAVGSAGAVVTSATGASWTSQTPPVTTALRAVGASSSLYLAVGDPDASNHAVFLTSTNGSSWTAVAPNPWSESGTSVSYLASAFYVGLSSGSVLRSTDGASYSYVLGPGGHGPPGNGAETDLSSIAWSGSVYVAGGGSDPALFSSPDGVTWTSRYVQPCCQGIAKVIYGNGRFVAVGSAGAGPQMLSSPDGITWTKSTGVTGTGYLQDVAAGPGPLFVAVGSTGASLQAGLVYTSTDGLSWTQQTSTSTNALTSIAFGAGLFVAVGQGICSSPDGVHWTPRSSPTTSPLGQVVFGNSTFVAVSSAPSTLTSPDGVTWTNHAQSAGPGTLFFGNGVFLTSLLSTSADGISFGAQPAYPEGGQLAAAVYGSTGWVGAGFFESFWRHP